MTASVLELQDLYNEALVRELLEKTQNCGITWTSLGGNQFQATSIDTVPNPDVTWDFFITKTQIASLTYKYSLDVKKNGVAQISIADGPLTYTSRDSVVKDLYEVVEITVLTLDDKIKETVKFVQGLVGCG
jgi:hypothetical protein